MREELHGGGWPIGIREDRDPQLLRQLVYEGADEAARTRIVACGRAEDWTARRSGTQPQIRRAHPISTGFAGVQWALLELFEKKHELPPRRTIHLGLS